MSIYDPIPHQVHTFIGIMVLQCNQGWGPMSLGEGRSILGRNISRPGERRWVKSYLPHLKLWLVSDHVT